MPTTRLSDIKRHGYADTELELVVVDTPKNNLYGEDMDLLMYRCMVRDRKSKDDLKVCLIIFEANGLMLKKGYYLKLLRFKVEVGFVLLVDKKNVVARAPSKPIRRSTDDPLAPSAKFAELSLSAGPGPSAAAQPAQYTTVVSLPRAPMCWVEDDDERDAINYAIAKLARLHSPAATARARS